jgi:ATP-dependent Lon protease
MPFEQLDLPVIPLRNMVMFPRSVQPIVIGRSQTLAVLESLAPEAVVLLVTQRDDSKEEPDSEDLYGVGVSAHILKRTSVAGADRHAVVVAQSLDRMRIARSGLRAHLHVPFRQQHRGRFASCVCGTAFLQDQRLGRQQASHRFTGCMTQGIASNGRR